MFKETDRLNILALPVESFVPFSAPKLANPTAVWSNDELLDGRDPLQFAACRPCAGEDPSAYLADEVILQAERYGGPGLANNGGGVRCGLLDGIQVKGSGRNSLAGLHTDHWHKHGACSIQDAIKEVVWGELLEAALPYGAARGFAIILTGTYFSVEVGEYKLPGRVPRALLLREAVIRPAHFMRSIFFKPEDAGSVPTSDVARTAAAIGRLPAIGRQLTRAKTDADHVAAGLSECFRRAAAQIASSRAKRLIHGSLTASNFALDGRWLDFGTATALASYRRTVVAPGSAEAWKQETTVFDTIRDLSFYIAKYIRPSWVSDGKSPFDAGMPFVEKFASELRFRERLEFLKLTGAPEEQILRAPEEVVEGLWKAFRSFLAIEQSTPYLYYGDNRHLMPLPKASNSLNLSLRSCALSKDEDHARCDLERAGVEEKLASQMAHSYWRFRAQIETQLKTGSETDRNISLAFAIRGMRLNGSWEGLWRRMLDGDIDVLSRDPASIGSSIDGILSKWIPVLSSSEMVSLDGWFVETKDMCISERLTFISRQQVVSGAKLLSLIAESRLSPEEKSALREMAT